MKSLCPKSSTSVLCTVEVPLTGTLLQAVWGSRMHSGTADSRQLNFLVHFYAYSRGFFQPRQRRCSGPLSFLCNPYQPLRPHHRSRVSVAALFSLLRRCLGSQYVFSWGFAVTGPSAGGRALASYCPKPSSTHGRLLTSFHLRPLLCFTISERATD